MRAVEQSRWCSSPERVAPDGGGGADCLSDGQPGPDDPRDIRPDGTSVFGWPDLVCPLQGLIYRVQLLAPARVGSYRAAAAAAAATLLSTPSNRKGAFIRTGRTHH